MSNPMWIKGIQNMWHAIVHDSKKEVIDNLAPLADFLESKGGPAIIAVATAYLAGQSPAAPWAALIAQFLPIAETYGVKLLSDEAGIVLNIAKAKLRLTASV